MRAPVVTFVVFSTVIAATYFYVSYGDAYGLHPGKLSLFGVKASVWLFYFMVWHSMVHFYFDGFLWKMRAPAVRASL